MELVFGNEPLANSHDGGLLAPLKLRCATMVRNLELVFGNEPLPNSQCGASLR